MAVIQHSGSVVVGHLLTPVAVGYTPVTGVAPELKEVQTFDWISDKLTNRLPTTNTQSYTQVTSSLTKIQRRTPRDVIFKGGVSRQVQDELANPSSWIINKVHFIPEVLDLGVVTGFTREFFNVWCTYLRPQQLQSITPNNAAGLELDSGLTLPTEFGEFAYYEMSIVTGTEGQNVIDARYDFALLNGETYDLEVTGNRSLVFSHPHNWESEVLLGFDWLTSVLTAEDGSENRQPLRHAPRVSVNNTALVTEDQERVLRQQLSAWHSKAYSLPLWHMQMQLGVNLTAGDLTFTLDADSLGLKDGMSLMFFNGWEDYEVRQVDTINLDGTVTLTTGVLVDWTSSDRVMPVTAATVRQAVRIADVTSTISSIESIQFEVEPSNTDDFAPTLQSLATFKNDFIFPLRPNWSRDVPTTYSKPKTTKVDYQSAAPLYYDADTQVAQTTSWTYLCKTRAEIQELLGFLYQVRGRLKAFWQPTYKQDFRLIRGIAAGTSILTVRDTDFVKLLGTRTDMQYLYLELDTGATYHLEITNAVVNTAGELVLTVDRAITEQVANHNVRFLSFLQRLRLDVDSVSVALKTDSIATCSLTMVTTKGG